MANMCINYGKKFYNFFCWDLARPVKEFSLLIEIIAIDKISDNSVLRDDKSLKRL